MKTDSIFFHDFTGPSEVHRNGSMKWTSRHRVCSCLLPSEKECIMKMFFCGDSLIVDFACLSVFL